MKTERVMLVGAVGAGKTTLIKALSQSDDPVTKTQAIQYQARSIDTPGEYMENPMFYRALFSTSLEAQAVLLIQDASKGQSIFPPGFAQAFPKKTIGIVSKIDHPDADVERAIGFLQKLCVNGPIVTVSALTGEGVEKLRHLLNWQD